MSVPVDGTGRGRRLLLAACVAVGTGCATLPRPAADQWRPVAPAEAVSGESFRLAGRFAVSDGRDGGSAAFVWVQRGQRYDVELRQPVSQRTWRLRGDDDGAVLEGDARGPRRGASAQDLLRDLLGWDVPVAGLRWWLRGLVAPGQAQPPERDDRGRLRAFEQDGWRVEYRGWLDDGAWPTRLQAQRGDHRLRISVQEWAVPR